MYPTGMNDDKMFKKKKLLGELKFSFHLCAAAAASDSPAL